MLFLLKIGHVAKKFKGKVLLSHLKENYYFRNNNKSKTAIKEQLQTQERKMAILV